MCIAVHIIRLVLSTESTVGGLFRVTTNSLHVSSNAGHIRFDISFVHSSLFVRFCVYSSRGNVYLFYVLYVSVKFPLCLVSF